MAIVVKPFSRSSVVVERKFFLINFSLVKVPSPLATLIGRVSNILRTTEIWSKIQRILDTLLIHDLPVPVLQTIRPTPECQNLKSVMKRILYIEKDMKKYESYLAKPKPGGPTKEYKQLLHTKRHEREKLVRELQLLPPCTDPDCPNHFSAHADSTNARKNSHSEDVNVNFKKLKPQNAKKPKIIRMTLSSLKRPLDLTLLLKPLNQY
ncbi:hypothetical protein TNCV_5034511 [Trichonephila clavipes]|nr:hypothetical protein TNCV_5034511 [Trichonephila clavipes]